MKLLILTMLLTLTSISQAEPTYQVNGKAATKLEAVMSLMKDKNADVIKCAPQELTEKITLKNRKSLKTALKE